METVTSLHEYIEIIDVLSDALQHDLFRNDTLLYRGLSNSEYELIPSIGRYVNSNVHNSLVWFEKEVINEALRKLPEVFGGEEYPVDLLTKLQHYGVPTRLLDITFNALVALFFACKNDKTDGKVVVFKSSTDKEKYIYSRENTAISIMAKQYEISGVSFYSFDKYIDELRSEHRQALQTFFTSNSDDREAYMQRVFSWINEPICFVPLELSERQKRQQGAFFIFPNKTKVVAEMGRCFLEDVKPMDETNKWIEMLIIIPVAQKSTIRKHLENYGITEDYLFPDTATICSAITKNVVKRFI